MAVNRKTKVGAVRHVTCKLNHRLVICLCSNFKPLWDSVFLSVKREFLFTHLLLPVLEELKVAFQDTWKSSKKGRMIRAEEMRQNKAGSMAQKQERGKSNWSGLNVPVNAYKWGSSEQM